MGLIQIPVDCYSVIFFFIFFFASSFSLSYEHSLDRGVPSIWCAPRNSGATLRVIFQCQWTVHTLLIKIWYRLCHRWLASKRNLICRNGFFLTSSSLSALVHVFLRRCWSLVNKGLAFMLLSHICLSLVEEHFTG